MTFSVQKSITVLHAAFEHQEVQARRVGDGTQPRRGRAQAGRRGRDLGGAPGGDGLPRGEGRLLPGRSPRRRGRAVYGRARTDRCVVLPARQPRGRPAPAHPWGCPQPGRGHRRRMAHAGRPRPVPPQAGRGRGRGPHRHRASGAVATSAGGDAPGRQGARDPRRGRRGEQGCCPPAGGRSPRRPPSWSPRSGSGTAARRTPWSWTGCSRRAATRSRAGRSRTGGDNRAAPGPGGRRSCARRSTGRAWRASPATCSGKAGQRRARADVQPGRGHRDRARRSAGMQGGLDRGGSGRGRSATRCRTTSADCPAREVAEVLDTLDPAGHRQEARNVDRRTDRPAMTLPAELRLANGALRLPARPVSSSTPPGEHVRSERALRAAAIERTAARLTPELRANAFLDELAESGIELGVDQAAAVRGVLTSGAGVESLVGPAGTGKSFVVGARRPCLAGPDPLERRPAPGDRTGHGARSLRRCCRAKA